MNTTLPSAAVAPSRWSRCGRRLLAVTAALLTAALAWADYAVTTLAGTAGSPGYVNGTGAAARFRFVTIAGAAADSAGNIYVADAQNNVIRKITPAGVVSTFAGAADATAGADNGTGTAARFNSPEGLAIDGADTLYVADTGNHLIRRITSAGAVTTLAGNGNGGYSDATGTSAQFRSPMGVAVAPGTGAATVIFVCDTQNNVIRQITVSTGAVTTLAGSAAGTAGATDGVGTAAMFSNPITLVADATGATVYVADAGNSLIRKVVIAGGSATVSTLAGSGVSGYANGTGIAAQFTSPRGIALDASGNLVVSDTLTHTLRSVTPAGGVTLLAGTPSASGTTNGLATSAAFYYPSGIAVVGTTAIYVVDAGNNTVRQISTATVPTITTAPVSTTVTVGLAATFSAAATGNPVPTYRWQRQRTGDAAFSNLSDGSGYAGSTTATLTISPTTALMNGDLYRVVATSALGSATSTSAQLTPALGLVFSTLAGTAGSAGATDGTGAAARFSIPGGVAVDSFGDAYVADTVNGEIRMVGPTGAVTTIAGKVGSWGTADGIGAAAQFNSPTGIAVDSAGVIYVADTAGQTIRKVLSNGTVTTIAGKALNNGFANGVGTAAQFNFPNGVAVDATGVLYVADTVNHAIRKIATDGTVTTFAGLSGTPGSADGNGTAARFNQPYGVAVDSSGNVYVADTLNATIRKITPAGDVTTLAGTAGTIGVTDGTGAAALFNQPKALTVANATTLYVSDTANHTIRKVTTAGVVTTVAGAAGVRGAVDAIATAARFNEPNGIAVDASGNVYVADSRNDTIRRTGAFTAPQIQTQPTDQSTRAAIAATFRVVATALPSPAYQWQRQAAGTTGFFNLDDGAQFSGSTTATLLVVSPTEAMSGDQYRVVVTNLVSPSATSVAANLTVGPPTLPPTIVAQPAGVTVNRGDAANLSVGASGSGTLAYQWSKDGTTLAGATKATLVFTAVQPTDAGSYRVVVTNAFGSVTSNTVTVTLAIAPTILATQHAQAGMVGGSITLGGNIVGAAGTTYQWMKNGAAIAGATGATLTLSNLAVGDAGLYNVTATNPLGATTTSLVQVTVSAGAVVPAITVQPTGQALAVGSALTLQADATGAPAPTFQWRKNGVAISGATNTTLGFASVQAGDAADYDVVVTNSAGATTSSVATIRVLARSYAGTYFGSFGNGLGTFALYVRPDNTGVFFGAITTTLAPVSTMNLAVSDTGDFAFNQTATPAQAVNPSTPPVAEALGAIAVAGNIATNGTVSGTLSGAVAVNLAATRQSDQGSTSAIAGLYLAGALDGANYAATILGATGQAYVLVQMNGAADGGTGTADSTGHVAVSTTRTAITETIVTATGTVTTTAVGALNASFTGASESALGTQRLVNISTRARVSGGDSLAIAGFAIGGSSAKLLLIRAIGPTLAGYGVSGVLAAPKLELYRGQTLMASNIGVGTSPSAAAITAAGAAAGAFSPALNPADSALLITLPPGIYTAQVSGADGGAGIALVEVYDLSASESGQKLKNISTRAYAASGDNTLIAGVVVPGSVPKRVLIRAVGPGLTAYQVTGVLAQPMLTLKTQAGQTIAQNTGWTTSPDTAAITSAALDVGAFPLITGDSAMVITLAPGNYSAQVTGAGGGIALVEVYELQ